VSYYDDVVDFHHKAGVPAVAVPLWPPDDRVELRFLLLKEEVEELYQEMESEADLALLAKELCDVIVVVCGTAAEYGIPLNEVWALVHTSNMAKIPANAADRRYRADGKLLKPNGWRDPIEDIRLILAHKRDAQTTEQEG
jgi:predicted HAD superfamily Cof-like phosphohydrolase